ncbi:MAG: serine/threonine-protein kinase, partial [Myxococcota bacterium]
MSEATYISGSVTGGVSRPIPEPGGPSHGRYRLGEVIGSGGFGQVHRAVDTLTGDVVAVKFVRALSAADLRRARRELAALRWLRLPGVVRLRDDGLEGASWFMVMDLVEGRRFDAFRGWSNVRPLALELLEILARVHLAGVVHRDLKPSNLVVTATGRVVVLDFGIAGGRAVPEVRGCPEGTPRYMAPEQVRGDPTDPRTDLFAVGMMIGELCPDLPPGPRRVVDAMRAHTVRDRPESALEAYRDLAGRSLFPAALDRAEPWTSEALGDLFQPTGDAFTHLRSDAVALVRERTQGDPGRVRRTLEQWILAGFVSWTDGGLVVDRLGLDRLAGGGSLDLLRGDPVVLAREAIGAAQVMRARGQVSPAIAVTDLVLPLAATIEGGDRFEAEAGLLKERVLAAIMLQSPAQLNLALYAIERAAPSPAVERLDALARAARSALRDELGPARAALRTVEPFADPELEVRRAAVLVRAAAIEGQAAEAQALEGLEGWAVG